MKRIVFIIAICFTCNSGYSQINADTSKQLINLVIESMRHDTDIINVVYDAHVSRKRKFKKAPQRFLSKYMNESGIHFSGYTPVLNRIEYRKFVLVDSIQIHNPTLPDTKRKIFAQIVYSDKTPDEISVYITFNDSPPEYVISNSLGSFIRFTYTIKDGVLQKEGGYMIGW